jgi:hypothetical protein
MLMASHRLLVLMAALAACLLVPLGCSDKSVCPCKESSPFLARTSPENVLENLKLCYGHRAVAEYESLLAQDFAFEPSEGDYELPDQWGRNQEVAIHRNMFDAELVQTLSLGFDVGERVFDSTAQLWTIMVTNVDLNLFGMTPHLQTPKEYSVVDGTSRFWFRRNSWNAPGTQEKTWTIVKWEDEPIDLLSRPRPLPAATNNTSWGTIKAIFM